MELAVTKKPTLAKRHSIEEKIPIGDLATPTPTSIKIKSSSHKPTTQTMKP